MTTPLLLSAQALCGCKGYPTAVARRHLKQQTRRRVILEQKCAGDPTRWRLSCLGAGSQIHSAARLAIGGAGASSGLKWQRRPPGLWTCWVGELAHSHFGAADPYGVGHFVHKLPHGGYLCLNARPDGDPDLSNVYTVCFAGSGWLPRLLRRAPNLEVGARRPSPRPDSRSSLNPPVPRVGVASASALPAHRRNRRHGRPRTMQATCLPRDAYREITAWKARKDLLVVQHGLI